MDAFARLEVKKLLDRLVGVPLVQVLRACDAILWLFQSHAPIEPRRIVLTKLWGIGNLAMILPFVSAVRARYPRAHITFVTLEENRELVRAHPDLDRVATLRSRGVLAPLLDLLRLTLQLRREQVDLYLDFEQFLRTTALLGYLAGCKQRIGFRTPGQSRHWLFNARVPYQSDRHMVAVFGAIVRAAGVTVNEETLLWVPRDAAAANRVAARVARHPQRGPLVVLHPGSGDNFPGRRWPVDRFAALGKTLVGELDAAVIVTGSESERPLARAAAAAIGERAVSLAGELDLQELIELVAHCDLLVSNDTAPVHLAGAVDANVIALYGPNTPLLYGPVHARGRAIYHDLPCSPCLTNMNMKSSSCRMPACVLGIEVEEVMREARRLLAMQRRQVAAHGAPP